MSLADASAALAIGLAALLVAGCVRGAVNVRDPVERLHRLAPQASLAAFLVVIAAMVHRLHAWRGCAVLLAAALLLVGLNRWAVRVVLLRPAEQP